MRARRRSFICSDPWSLKASLSSNSPRTSFAGKKPFVRWRSAAQVRFYFGLVFLKWSRSPEPVQDRATAFLLAVKDVPLKAGGEEKYRAAVESLLRGTFEELKIAVGPVVTEQLRAWSMRSFVDHDETMRLWIWSLLLPRLAGAYGHSAKTPPPLPTARMQRFNDIVRSYFSPEIRQEDDDLAERARREPLSPLEQELVPARII